MLGLNKNVDQRLQEIDNLSDRTERMYQNQKDKIKKDALRLTKKK